jgi:hypothetical protein
MSRDRSACSKMTTHTPSAGPICVSGKLESSIDSESGFFASDRPRFRFRDDGAIDTTRDVRLCSFKSCNTSEDEHVIMPI